MCWPCGIRCRPRPDPLRQPETGGDPGVEGDGIGRCRSGSSRSDSITASTVSSPRPGKDGSHAKGRVKGEIGRFRRRHLVPVPRVASPAELNELIAAGDALDDARVITGRTVTVSAAFTAERTPALQPLPAKGLRHRAVAAPRVDAKARICVRQRFYSVPACYVGRRLSTPPRRYGPPRCSTGRGSWPGTSGRSPSTPRSPSSITTWRSSGQTRRPAGGDRAGTSRGGRRVHRDHQRYWDATRQARGDTAGTKALIEVLLAHRSVPADAVLTAMSTAVDNDQFDPHVVLIEARRHAEKRSHQ
jgi:hypothetical protein